MIKAELAPLDKAMKNKLISYLILVHLIITFSFSNANELPTESNVPGGIVIVPITSKDRPKAFFYDKKVMVIGEIGNWKAIIGIPLKIELGEHKLKVISNGAEANHVFEVVNKDYESQYLTIKNKR